MGARWGCQSFACRSTASRPPTQPPSELPWVEWADCPKLFTDYSPSLLRSQTSWYEVGPSKLGPLFDPALLPHLLFNSPRANRLFKQAYQLISLTPKLSNRLMRRWHLKAQPAICAQERSTGGQLTLRPQSLSIFLPSFAAVIP